MKSNCKIQLLGKVKANRLTTESVNYDTVRFIRYPGGKQRILRYIIPHLPPMDSIKGNYVEPFVGSGAVFFAVNPLSAILSDLNSELIEMYEGIRDYPERVWSIFRSFPSTKTGYYRIRATKTDGKDIAFRAARTLFLNRTCFKGMWRHNAFGEFNVGYGGQDRRWAINEENLKEVSSRLKHAQIKNSDFESIVNETKRGDFVFLDPPYAPGKCELIHAHYTHGQFTYEDHIRLANTLKRASNRGVRWAMTISSHSSLMRLYAKESTTIPIPKGTGHSPGIMMANAGEVLLTNYSR